MVNRLDIKITLENVFPLKLIFFFLFSKSSHATWVSIVVNVKFIFKTLGKQYKSMYVLVTTTLYTTKTNINLECEENAFGWPLNPIDSVMTGKRLIIKQKILTLPASWKHIKVWQHFRLSNFHTLNKKYKQKQQHEQHSVQING